METSEILVTILSAVLIYFLRHIPAILGDNAKWAKIRVDAADAQRIRDGIRHLVFLAEEMAKLQSGEDKLTFVINEAATALGLTANDASDVAHSVLAEVGLGRSNKPTE